ncbi:Transcriptional regulator [Commensalibacter communis]|nr:Transcriptional regulator [Commensalibacter communis]CAI3959151.1 Transcriptional regulator [Commensalibacter communis]
MPENIPTVGDRIRFLRKGKNITQVELATELGIARPTLTRIEKNNDKASDRIIEEISSIFDVPKNWIRHGKEIIQMDVSLEENEILEIIRNLKETEQQFIFDFIRNYVKTKCM